MSIHYSQNLHGWSCNFFLLLLKCYAPFCFYVLPFGKTIWTPSGKTLYGELMKKYEVRSQATGEGDTRTYIQTCCSFFRVFHPKLLFWLYFGFHEMELGISNSGLVRISWAGYLVSGGIPVEWDIFWLLSCNTALDVSCNSPERKQKVFFSFLFYSSP